MLPCALRSAVATFFFFVAANGACQDDEVWLNDQSWNTGPHKMDVCAKVLQYGQCGKWPWTAQACPVTCKEGCASSSSATCEDDDQWVAAQGWHASITTCSNVASSHNCESGSAGYSKCPVSCSMGCCSPDAINTFGSCQSSCEDDDASVAALTWANSIGITTCFGLEARGLCSKGGGLCPVSCGTGCCTPGSIAPKHAEACAKKTCKDNQAVLLNYIALNVLPASTPQSCPEVAQNGGYCNSAGEIIFKHSCPVSCGVGCCAPSSNKGDGSLPFTVPFETSQYAHSMKQLSDDANTGAAIHWRNDDDYVYFGLAANSRYVAFGLNVKGPGMPGADIIICREESGQVIGKDYHSVESTWPTLDAQQDWTTLGGGVTGDVIWCEVKRPRAACNLDQDVPLVDLDRMMYFLVAWAPNCVDTGYYGYHGVGNRRTGVFDFHASGTPAIVENELNFQISAPVHTVSTAPGSYACSYHKLPLPDDGANRVDIIRHSIEQGGSSFQAGLNHHVDVVKCKEPLSYSDGQTVDCDTTMAQCLDMMMGLYRPLPANQGIPVGGKYSKYIVLRRHFYNPGAKAGLVDSGTKYNVVYSTSLRPHVLSSLSMSIDDAGINIPVNTMKTVSNLCPATCTQRLGAVKIAQVFFHMHFVAGSSAVLRVIRDGQELEPIASASPWVVGQDISQTNFDLLPGDILKLDCTYDNKNDFVVTGGPAIHHEMCWAGLTLIGPPTSMTFCHSVPTQSKVWCPSDTETSGAVYTIPSAIAYDPPNYDNCVAAAESTALVSKREDKSQLVESLEVMQDQLPVAISHSKAVVGSVTVGSEFGQMVLVGLVAAILSSLCIGCFCFFRKRRLQTTRDPCLELGNIPGAIQPSSWPMC